MLFATCFWAKNALCHEFKMLSQVVEEEFAFFLGIGRKALYFCLRKREQAAPQQLRVNSIAFLD